MGWNQLGDLWLRMDRASAAIRAFRRAGEGFLQREQHARALAVLKKASRLAPLDTALVEQLVYASRLSNRPQVAAEAYFVQSRLYAAQGDELAALRMFARGVAENPLSLKPRLRLVQWCKSLGRRDQAADLLLEVAELMGQRQDLDRAYRFLARARELRNGPKSILVEVKILKGSGRHEAAAQLFHAARTRFPNHPGFATPGPEGSAHPGPLDQDWMPTTGLLLELRQQLLQAETWRANGYDARALSLLQRMLIKDPGFQPALSMAEDIHQASGKASRFHTLCLTCAERLAAQERRSEAAACLDRAEQIFPGSSRAYRHRFGLDGFSS